MQSVRPKAPFWAHRSEKETEDQMQQKFHACLQDETGATAIEYGLIASLIAAVIIAAVTLLGTDLQTTFQGLADVF